MIDGDAIKGVSNALTAGFKIYTGTSFIFASLSGVHFSQEKGTESVGAFQFTAGEELSFREVSEGKGV